MSAFWKKSAAIGFLLFVLLFLGGILRSFALSEPDLPALAIALPSSSYSLEDFRSQMKTANNLKQVGLAQALLPQILNPENVNKIQVYEKTAQLASATTAFAEDEALTRHAIADHQATVFNERRTGIAPARRLSLGIAVHPDHFDTLLHELEEIGQISSITVQQQDRTAEFRKLHAQQQALKKHQEAILKLREGHKLSVEEALKLEQKIQDLEKESQAVGMQLGDLLGKEPSYNLFLELDEVEKGSSRDRSFTLSRRLGSAFVWALGWWTITALGMGMVVGTVVSIRTLGATDSRMSRGLSSMSPADPPSGGGSTS